MLRNRWIRILGFLSFCILPQAHAEDKALLIGAGTFEEPAINQLPGIDLDIANIRQVVGMFGFKDQQIRELSDREGAAPATLANIEQMFTGWLREDVQADDRIFIYFSGHGAQIPDVNGDEAESDGADEILLLRDTRLVKTNNGGRTLINVLADDRFGELLAALPSRNVFVAVDACHSGTATRAFTLPGATVFKTLDAVPKRWSHPDIPSGGAAHRSFFVKRKSTRLNYVALTAARDNETALATRNGSIFTQGFMQAVQAAAESGQITPIVLRDAVAQFIDANVQPDRVFVPQLSGDPELQKQNLTITVAGPAVYQPGPQWQGMVTMAQNGAAFPVALNQTRFVKGDILEMTFDIPQEGYLNVININAQDEATILFPNRFHAENRVAAGVFKVPTDKMRFRLRAGAPFGPSLIVAVLTQMPLDTYKSGDALGAQDVFRVLSEQGMAEARSFTVEAVEPFLAGLAIANVCPTAEQCNK